MSAQPTEAVDAIAHLDWHEARRCEHTGHRAQPEYHADGGELFIEIHCPNCEHDPILLVLCAAFIGLAYSGKVRLRCIDCGYRTTEATDFYSILGPAN